MNDPVLALLQEAQQALRLALEAEQEPLALDARSAAEVYAARQALADRVIGLAHCGRIRALSQLGELL